MVVNLSSKVAAKIRAVLPLMYNCEADYLKRMVTTDSFGANEISFVADGKISGLHIGKGDSGFVPDIVGDKEWSQVTYIFYCLTDKEIKLRDKIQANGLTLSVISIWKFEDVNIIGLGEEL